MENDMECDSRSQDWTVSSLTGSKKDKLCLVCGDKALGYNFNAVSCESCKAFFRRNAHKTIRGRCEGKCDVNVESRSFCKRCRLQKCFTVGMRKDMILNEQQKKVRKQKIIINKLKKHGQLPLEESCASTSVELSEEFEAKICSQSRDELRSTFPNLSEKELGMLSKLKQENIDELKSSRSTQEDEACPSWIESQELTEDTISKMPEINRSVLRELLRANEQSAFLANTSTEIKSIPTNATEFINVAEGFVRRVIKLAKNIEFFKMVTKEDQIALLKGSVTEIMMLRSAVNYDVATESWNLSTKTCLKNDQANSTSLPGKEPLGTSLPHSSQTSNVAANDNNHPADLDLTKLHNVFPPKDKSSPVLPDTAGIKMEVSSTSSSTSCSRTGASLDIEKLRAQFSGGADLSQLRAKFSGGADLSQLRAQFQQKVKDGTLGDSPAAKIGAELLKNGNSETRAMFMSYATFIKSLMKTIHGDVLMLKILIMLSLFSSDRPGLEETHKIEEIQECYAQILQAYVGARFPDEKILFAKVIMKLTDLRDINELHTKMLLKMKVESIEPLLVEIFDLPL
ncbi:vitamin D3 receptor-like isoform X2 [Mizuhopecten yessoensis]|uniref:Thyroid hormone receptor beta n=1 Tax=Mizuhopecten yessoensis TaxID=6573 RepID=A0A210R341_MIZYE|nr:vitamin D3 receptor-like isoform X2 [Mizuhopecten yessoensis]OWF55407.1 Thyroid hormone receptor beta [Mizuhopecten yessoensis]